MTFRDQLVIISLLSIYFELPYSCQILNALKLLLMAIKSSILIAGLSLFQQMNCVLSPKFLYKVSVYFVFFNKFI